MHALSHCNINPEFNTGCQGRLLLGCQDVTRVWCSYYGEVHLVIEGTWSSFLSVLDYQ